jgi:ribosomal protein L7/L12
MNAKLLRAVREATTEQLADIALQFAERYPDTFEAMLIPSTPPPARVAGRYPNGTRYDMALTPAQLGDIKAAGKLGKINAIKAVRTALGVGLYEAKHIVDDHPGWYVSTVPFYTKDDNE